MPYFEKGFILFAIIGLLSIFSMVLFTSCKDEKKNSDNKKDHFLMKYYNSDGEIDYYGMMTKDSIRVGRWIRLQENGNEVHYDYTIILGQEYLNQHWVYNTEGEIIGGHFIDDYSTQDTIMLNNDYVFRFALTMPIFSSKSELMFIYSEDFNNDFSNFREVKKDTVRNLQEVNPNYGKDMPLNLMIEFSQKLDKKGDYQLRGVFQEINYEEKAQRTREIFYVKNIYVNDSM